uniref:DUF4953 domain-containing protein n=1 Tax=Rhabditophanes sp. KR3021 TaxID=114890 RepID=A0AC35UH91_9BILA
MSFMKNRCQNASYLILLLPICLFMNCLEAIPKRELEPWSMILCKFKDTRHIEPRTREFFQEWLSGNHPDSIKNYFKWLSNGNYDITGSNVVGWYELPYTRNEVLFMSQHDEDLQNGDEKSFAFFDKVKQLCINEAEKKKDTLFGQKITVINIGSTALYGKKYGVLLTPALMFSSVLTHEMVHSFFIGHSYSDRNIKIFPFAERGEYDDRYDLMSTANAYMHKSRFGMAGPGLNGAHLDYLGWLPMDRMLYFGRDGRHNYTLRISSLSIKFEQTHGWLYVMIPYNRDDPNLVYTVELKTPTYFDRGIKQASILIHRIQKTGDFYYSVLISQSKDFYELTEGTEWVTFLNSDANGKFQWIKISVKKMYSFDADVTITTTFDPTMCQMGEVLIEQNSLPGDDQKKELITPVKDTPKDAKTDIQYCQPKRDTAIDKETLMKKQLQRNRFYTNLHSFGLNQCVDGKVWRSIDDYDYVCVDARRRDDVRLNNVGQLGSNEEDANITERRAKKSTGCKRPFLNRDAFHGDSLCVSSLEHRRVLQENVNAHLYLKHYAFFNGADTVGP